MRGIIFVDPQKCLACKSCEMACAVEHSKSKDLYKAIAESPAPQGRIKVEAQDEFVIPLQCRQCEDAPCVKICPAKALEKPRVEQPVLIKEELCIGCKWCILVCPFGVIKMDRQGKAIIKCDLCFERLKDDKLPACVLACPTKALQYKTIEEIAAEKRKDYLMVWNFKKKFQPLKIAQELWYYPKVIPLSRSDFLVKFVKGKEII